jgi:hypothetical protein
MTGGARPSASARRRGKAVLLAGLRWAGRLAGLRRQGESGGARADLRAGPENKTGQIGIGVKR